MEPKRLLRCLHEPPLIYILSQISPVKHAFLLSTMQPTFPAHLLFVDLIIAIIPGEGNKLWTTSLCSCLQPPFTSCPFSLNILLVTLSTNTLSLRPSLKLHINHAIYIAQNVSSHLLTLIVCYVKCTDRKAFHYGIFPCQKIFISFLYQKTKT
jgi:hypothetical protein